MNAGAMAGRTYVKLELLSEDQLDLLTEFDEVRGRMRFDGPYTLAEHVAFAIEGLGADEYDRQVAARFWEPCGDVNDLDDDYVDAFIEGALSVPDVSSCDRYLLFLDYIQDHGTSQQQSVVSRWEAVSSAEADDDLVAEWDALNIDCCDDFEKWLTRNQCAA